MRWLDQAVAAGVPAEGPLRGGPGLLVARGLRAVRVRGEVVEASRHESGADLAARSAAARADVPRGDWQLWRVVAARVEFWQGSADRRHTRIVDEPVDGPWRHTVL